ncbi:MAG: ribosomal protein S18-alanine N-acetyltransferase [Rubrivivax sp.]|nr:ribosomal protein S18-alanine N-acetyltransferase [Pyrinomonadaceae bacterium]
MRTTVHDLVEVVEIEETCGLSRWGWESYSDELNRPESIMLVARRPHPDETGRSLSGFVAARVNADELHINNIGVRCGDRRQGIGTALLKSAIECGRALGTRSAILEVRAGNESAQSLYLSHGFAVVGRRRNYYQGPAEDALVMSALLADLRLD